MQRLSCVCGAGMETRVSAGRTTIGLPLYIYAVKNKSAAEGREHYNGEGQVTHVQVQPGAAPGEEKDQQSQLDQGLDGQQSSLPDLGGSPDRHRQN